MQPWERNQYVMVATVFVVFAGFAFVLPFLPLYVKELGVVGDERVALWSGVLIGIGPLLAGLLAPVWGKLADRHGQKTMALTALGAYVALLALTAAARDVYDLLATRIGLGLFGGIGPLGLAMATAHAPREQTGKAVGLIQAAQILSAAVGPFAGGAVATAIGSRRTFLVASGVCVLAFALVAALYDEAPKGAAAAKARGPSLAETLRLPEFGVLLVVLFLVNFIGKSYTPILPLHLRALGVEPGRLAFSTGLLISVYSIAAAASATTLGRATRKRSPHGLLIASLVGGALTVLPMALVPSFALLLFFAVLLGLASGGALTLCYTIGGLSVPQECRTTAFGFFSGAALFGGAVSPLLAGALVHWNLRGIYFVNAALFALLAFGLAARRASARG
jgi:DHA1 family multidrug resistance protein-like MFS transporter